MNSNQILNTIERFTQSTRLEINELREIRSKYKNDPKTILDVKTDISLVKLSFRTYSDEIINRHGFIDLPVTALFCETSNIIENLAIRARCAYEDFQKGDFSEYLFEWLDDAIERLPKICEDLSDFIKNERNNPPGDRPQSPYNERPVRISVAAKNVVVSISSIKQAVIAGNITDYRKKEKSPHLVLESEIKTYFSEHGRKAL